MVTVRYTPDQKYELYDSIEFVLRSKEPATAEIVPTVSLFISKELIGVPPAQIDELDFLLTDAMKQLVVDYKIHLMTAGDIHNDLETLLINIQNIKHILENPNTKAYLYNHVDQVFSDLKQAGHTTMPWDDLLIGAPEQQERFFTCLINKIGTLPAHRPSDLETHRNTINKRFIERLMEIYKQATGKKATPVSASSNTQKPLSIIGTLQTMFLNQKKQVKRQSTPFVDFATAVIQTINDSYPGLNKGHNICFDISALVKAINKKRQ